MQQKVRYEVRVAITWRIISELLRRHHTRLDLRVYELHPGGGGYDCLSLYRGPFQSGLCHFNVGSQHLHTFNRVSPPRFDLIELRWPDESDYVQRYLQVEDPKQVVDEIEGVLGLPSLGSGPIPPSTPAVLAVRIIAELLERHALGRRGFVARCGWYDSSGYDGSSVRKWVYRIPHITADLPSQETWPKTASVAGRLWLLQRQNDKDGLVLDLKTGDGYWMAGASSHLPLWQKYKSNGRRIMPLLHQIEELFS